MSYSLINKFRGAFVGAWIANHRQLSQDWEQILTACLLYHDDLPSQTRELIKLCPPHLDQNGLTVMGYIIALICQQNTPPHPQKLIAQTRDFLITSPFNSCLDQIHRYVETSLGTVQVISQAKKQFTPEKLNFVLGFYYFFSTTEYYNLTINRSKSFTTENEKDALVIAGILSGCYNSILAIPTHWYQCQQEIVTTGDQIFREWAGFNHNIDSKSVPIAAAGVLQSR